MKYLAYDSTSGVFAGFYDTIIHENIPDNVIEISEDQYKQILRNLNDPSYPNNIVVINGFLSEVPREYDLSDMKERKVDRVKKVTYSKLQESDWKVLRHRDQVAAGQGTSLTSQEYQDLLTERENIRIQSDDYEQQINDATSVDQINLISIEY